MECQVFNASIYDGQKYQIHNVHLLLKTVDGTDINTLCTPLTGNGRWVAIIQMLWNGVREMYENCIQLGTQEEMEELLNLIQIFSTTGCTVNM